MTDALLIQSLSVRAGPRPLLDVASLTVPDGQVTAVVGASGAGKTLLIRALAGVSEPSLTVTLHTNRPTTQIGWLPQQARTALDPYRTVGEQLSTTHRAHPDSIPVEQALERVGLHASDAARFPSALSGGMAQRVVLAQLLATGAKTLVVDEPTSGLDPLLAADIRATLQRVASAGPGILLVTHDLRRIDTSVKTVWVMHQGRCVEAADSLQALTSTPAQDLMRNTPGLGSRV